MSQDSSLPFSPYPSPPACISQTVTILLRSPLHALMSQHTMLLTLHGRKTGQSYTFPVTYLQESNTVFCLTRFNWWKNLRGSAEVMLRLRGKSVTGIAEPIFNQLFIAERIAQIVQRDAREAKYFSVKLNDHNLPDPASLQISAQHFVLIRIRLTFEEHNSRSLR